MTKQWLLLVSLTFTFVYNGSKTAESFPLWYLFQKALANWLKLQPAYRRAPARMASVETWGGFWQLAVPAPSAQQPPSKLSHLVENHSDLAKRKLERGREGRRSGKGGRGGWAEVSSQSLELWLWEKSVTLSSQNPLDRGGILSLVPLGLEKAIEGYFLRSEAKKERVGRKRRVKRLSEFAGSRMGNEQEERNNPKRQKHKATTKHKHNSIAATLRPTFSHRDFHNKNNPRAIWGASGSQSEIHRAKT